MKAITIWQPWATLLVDGPKKYETRSWATGYRGPIAIHAAKRLPRLIKKIVPALVVEYMQRYLARPLEDLPTGCIMGTAELVACHLIDDKFLSELAEGEERLGDFTLGRYAWEFRNMQALEDPVPVQGKQGLWNWERGGSM